MFELHPQLKEDCHLLKDWNDAVLLLHKNAALPWFIVVPKGEFRDLDDLPRELRENTLDRIDALSKFLKSEKHCDKVNVAALGNQVPQLHIHVIGRYTTDPCWPNPVWGNIEEELAWSESQLDEMETALPD